MWEIVAWIALVIGAAGLGFLGIAMLYALGARDR